MSVQAGILNFEGAPADRETLCRMSALLSDFGPDGESAYFHDSLGMLYRPFHTTSESRSENQPAISIGGQILTWDGRLDNRDELIAQLGPTLADERSDLDLVAAALDRWGENCFSRICGDWALTVWNPHDRVLLLARDFAGIRPLFYWRQPTSIMWSSHLAALVSCGRDFNLSSDYIGSYLTMWPDSNLTPYREINAVPPGHFIRVSGGGVTPRAYWTFDHRATIRYSTDAQYEEHFRFLFRQAVRRRLRTDSPVLAELSGGLDSSSIVCMADDILHKQQSEATRVDTFSYCDRGEPDEDDFSYFTKVEQERGRAGYHAEIYADGDSFSLEYPEIIATPGFGARSEIQTALAEVITRSKYRVILSGTGGDELLGQAFDPRVQMADLLVQCRLPTLAKQVSAWSVLIRTAWYRLFWEVLVLLLPASSRMRLPGQRNHPRWLNETFSRDYKLPQQLLQCAEGGWTWLPTRRDSFQTFATLSRQATYSSPVPAEYRYPYLDQNLVEFLSQIPAEQLVRPGERRSLMRRALKEIVPANILARTTKSAEGRCYALTLEKHWTEIQSVLKSLLISELGFVKEDQFREELVAMRRGSLSPHYVRLLRALSLEFWLRDMVGRQVISLCSNAKNTFDESPVATKRSHSVEQISASRRSKSPRKEANIHDVRKTRSYGAGRSISPD